MKRFFSRCICIHWYNKKYREEGEEEEEERPHPPAHNNGVSTVESGHGHDTRPDHQTRQHDKHDHKNEKVKPKLKAQPSMAREADLIKQPSATSDT